MNKFYDTSSLLLMDEGLFDEHFIISSITLIELESIKTSSHRDEDIKAASRNLIHALQLNRDKYTIIIYNDNMLPSIINKGLEINNDTKILASAIYCKDVIFFTNDLNLQAIASLFFPPEQIASVSRAEDTYFGYKEISFSDEELSDLYSNLDKNLYDLNINEYLIVKDSNNTIVDKLCWTGSEMRKVKYYNFISRTFGDVKPKPQDHYQALAMDSLANNKLTLLKGPAGSGKTFLALGYLLHCLEKHKIDKIIIFCNTVATKGSAKLGFYPGTRDEKLLDSQIGNLLASKLGDKIAVERMIEEGSLVLLPMSDVRGYDTSGMKAGVYISEAQNMDINLMKLALQRIGEDSFCILDGDPLAQVDDASFAGANNGMRRVSKVFRNTEVYGEVKLKTIHRSRIANIAEKL